MLRVVVADKFVACIAKKMSNEYLNRRCKKKLNRTNDKQYFLDPTRLDAWFFDNVEAHARVRTFRTHGSHRRHKTTVEQLIYNPDKMQR